MWACWGMVLSVQLSTSAIVTTSKNDFNLVLIYLIPHKGS